MSIPLHLYKSPNGNGLCTYEAYGQTCGDQKIAFIHMLPKIDPETPPDPVAKYLLEKGSAAYETYHGASFPVDDPPTTAQVVAMFNDQALRLAVMKNRAYGDAWRKQGYIGNLARILSKADRLRNMAWRDRDPEDPTVYDEHPDEDEETLRDTLLDMANLCAFAAHNIAKGNRWGDRSGN